MLMLFLILLKHFFLVVSELITNSKYLMLKIKL